MNACRLCPEPIGFAGGPSAFCYASRHWAHHHCYIKRWGEAMFTKLASQPRLISTFPWKLIVEHGLEAKYREFMNLPAEGFSETETPTRD